MVFLLACCICKRERVSWNFFETQHSDVRACVSDVFLTFDSDTVCVCLSDLTAFEGREEEPEELDDNVVAKGLGNFKKMFENIFAAKK